MKQVLAVLCVLACSALSSVRAMTWSGDPGPWGAGPMDAVIQTWNTYASYGYNIPVYYSSGIPTAQANYRGSIGFGAQGNYRTAMHESSHWMGTGTTGEWTAHQRSSIWNGTYTVNLRRAYDGPGERQFIYGVHYGPQGANYDSEGVQAPQMVGIIGAFRRDQNLENGDLTIGIAPDTYRLRARTSIKLLDSLGATTEGAPPVQNENGPVSTQEWRVNLVLGTRHFTVQNTATGKYLDSLGALADGSPVGLTTLVGGVPSDGQLWEINPTDSFFFKIINKANGRALDTDGLVADGSGVKQRTASGNLGWNQHWTFLHPLPQLAPPSGVISQGRTVSASSIDGAHYDTKGNNGVAGDRWTASSGTYPQWWQVDLGAVQPITKVEVDWFRDGAPTFQYRIEVSSDGSAFTVAADRTGNIVTGTTVDRVLTSGRYVRVVATGATSGYWAAFYECRVYNEVQPMRLLSPFRPATASSEQAGNLAVNANDVDPVFTRWCSATSGYPAWWQVDLGSAQAVNKAVIQWFDDEGRSYKYRIEGSADGISFTTLLDRTANTTPSVTTDSFSGFARYVRVTITGGSSTYPSLYDAQIYGATAPQPISSPENLAATVTGGQINLNWSAVAGASGYTVKRALSAAGPYVTLATPTVTSFADSGALAGVPYHYVVSATGVAGAGADSAPVSAAVNAVLRAYLPFDETGGTLAGDASGFGRSGTLVNGPLRAAGAVANAVDLDGTDDYVSLPAGIVSGLGDFTIAAWIYPDANAAWARLFDFGTGTDNYVFLAPTNGSVLRFAIRTPSVGEQQLSAAPLPAATWSHVAVTLSGNTATLYVNGVSVATNTAMTLRPSSLGITTNNWIGRAQFADPYLNGRVDDFRIYGRALTVAEVNSLRGLTAPASAPVLAALAGDARVALSWSSVLGATSYKVWHSAVSGGPYTTIATVSAAGHLHTGLVNGTPAYYVVSALNAAGESLGSAQAGATPVATPPAPPALLHPSEVGTQIKLSWAASASATSYRLKRATVSGGPYAVVATLGATNYTDAGITPGTVYYYVVSASGAGGESANSPQVVASPPVSDSAVYLKMDETAGTTTADASGHARDGTLANGATRTTGRIDRGLNLDGVNDHVTLPVGVADTLNDCTFSLWVRPATLGAGARALDFGTGLDNYLYLTVQGANGRPAFSIRTPGTPAQDIFSSVALVANTWTHLAVTLSGNVGTLYVNGVATGANGAMTLKPASLGATTLNYLGRSRFTDPYLTGQLDEFRIVDRALTAGEIVALATPPAAPIGVAATAGPGRIELRWNVVAGATGYTVLRGSAAGGPYAAIANGVATNAHTDTAVDYGTTYYYVVAALKQLAESPRSAEVNARPLSPVESWRTTHFGGAENTGDAADEADPDGDGIVNLLEFLLHGDPTTADSAAIAPVISREADTLTLTYTRDKTAGPGLAVAVEWTDSLSAPDWSVTGVTETIFSESADTQTIRASVPIGVPRRFLRLRVQPTAP